MGAVMGWTVHDVKRATMWEFFAAWHGYVDANTPKESAKLTGTEADALFDWIEQVGAGPRALSTQTYWWEGALPDPAGVVTFTLE